MSDMPDFDNMSQEEINTWLETLAKRQGATEGLTTSADMDIAEVDPNSVVIDEPGYVPYGQEQAAAKPPAASQPPAPEPPPAEPVPPAPVQPQQPTWITSLVEPPGTQQPPAAEQPPRPVQPPAPEPPAETPTPEPQPVETGGLAWLASLAADEGDSMFNLDLSGLGETVREPEAASAPAVNPMSWLEDLARSQVAEPSLEDLGRPQAFEPSLERLSADEEDVVSDSEKLNPYTQNVDPIEWLETLAARQGADPEELTTRARVNIPRADEGEVEQPDYEPFSFDTPPTRRSPEPVDTADWLNSLAGAEGYSESGVLATQLPHETPAEADESEPDEDLSMAAIADAIAAGTVTSDQMQHFLDQQAEQLANEPDDSADFLEEDDALLEPNELPDWLADLRPQANVPEPTKPLDALFETPAAPEMPDWLRQDVLDDDELGLEGIFASEEESRPLQPVSLEDVLDAELTGEESSGYETPAYEIDVDASDPWVEALDLEYEQGGVGDLNNAPEWYEQNVSDPTRIAAVENQVELENLQESPLEAAVLPPESDLQPGQEQAVPAWAIGYEPLEYGADNDAFEPELEAEAASADEPAYDAYADLDEEDVEMPDWLKELEATVAPQDVPDWLVQTISDEDDEQSDTVNFEPLPEVVQQPSAQVQPEPEPPPVVPPQPPPQAAPARVADGEAAAVLTRARDREQSGDLEGALAEYEAMVRSGVELETVVTDLTQLSRSYKTTPAVFRVLGDGLMRQGKLQAALNTYREALNQL